MKCAVIGGSHLAKGLTDGQRSAIEGMGVWLAHEGIQLLTGSCWGYPLLVAKACAQAGGVSVGYSPAHNAEEDREVYGHPQEGFTRHVFLDAGHEGAYARLLMRSVPLVDDADIVVSLEGNWGTLMEQTAAIVCGKPLVVLEPSGGASVVFRRIYPTLAAENRNNYGDQVAFVQTIRQVEQEILSVRDTGSLTDACVIRRAQ